MRFSYRLPAGALTVAAESRPAPTDSPSPMTRKKFEGTDYAGFFHHKKEILLKLGADPAIVTDARAHRQMIEVGILAP